jgi:hypothetical protein
MLAWRRYAADSHVKMKFAIATAVTVVFGLWPVVLQRYNRLRAYRAIGLFLGSRNGVTDSTAVRAAAAPER